MTNIYSDALSDLNWASRPGASGLLSICFLGTSVPAARPFSVLVGALPRVRGKAVPQAQLVPQAQKVAVGQTNIHNYMTGATAVGEGASGPPREKEPV